MIKLKSYIYQITLMYQKYGGQPLYKGIWEFGMHIVLVA